LLTLWRRTGLGASVAVRRPSTGRYIIRAVGRGLRERSHTCRQLGRYAGTLGTERGAHSRLRALLGSKRRKMFPSHWCTRRSPRCSRPVLFVFHGETSPVLRLGLHQQQRLEWFCGIRRRTSSTLNSFSLHVFHLHSTVCLKKNRNPSRFMITYGS